MNRAPLTISDFTCTALVHPECDSQATMSVQGNLLCDAHAARLLALILRDLLISEPLMLELGQAAELLERWPAPPVRTETRS